MVMPPRHVGRYAVKRWVRIFSFKNKKGKRCVIQVLKKYQRREREKLMRRERERERKINEEGEREREN